MKNKAKDSSQAQNRKTNSEFGFEAHFRTAKGTKLLRVLAEYKGQIRELGNYLVYFNKHSGQGSGDNPTDYQRWIQLYDTLTPADVRRMKSKIADFQRKPLISVIMPVYNTPEKYLREAIESVIDQVYEHWELCIADDASTKPHVRAILQEYKKKDPRIKVVYRTENGHISEASNTALELANGEWVALLDHDDMLRPHALLELTKAIDLNPSAGFIYSDEDKLNSKGDRYDPYFKHDWDPDLFLGQNYLCHLSAFPRSIVMSLGGFRKGYEGSQDYDLFLRITEKLAPSHIVHIPKVLYHWRAIEGSTATNVNEKDYTFNAGKRALADYLSRNQIDANLIPVRGGHWRVKYSLPKPCPSVSLIIPTRDKVEILKKCVDSILQKTSYPNYKIIIVNNASEDPKTYAYFSSLPQDKMQVLDYPHPFNYSVINNFAVSHTETPLVALINNDVEIIAPDWLEEMVSHANRPEIGCVGAKLYYPNDTIQHAGVVLGIGGVAGHWQKGEKRGNSGYFNQLNLTRGYSAVTAACLVVKKSIYKEVGGLDEENLKVAFNDIDFCIKVREAKYRNLFTPFAELYHHESISREHEDTPEKIQRFRDEVCFMKNKWGDSLFNDISFNPNLSLRCETLAFRTQ